MKLYRPVGLYEMEKILDSGGNCFPPRMKEQPFFYPVITYDYACKIAREWNAKDTSSGNVGYVTEFIIDDSFIKRKNYKMHCVGSKVDLEFWVPSNELEEFNEYIIGKIKIVKSFYGFCYKGILPTGISGFNESNIDKQIKLLDTIYKYNPFDFSGTVYVEWKILNLNLQYWSLFESNIDIVKKIKMLLEKNNKLFIE